MKLATVILAAGKGTRMKSSRAKVLFPVAGRAMVEYPIALSQALSAERIVAVLGHQIDEVRATIERRFGQGAVQIAEQKEQRGTGHAVMMAEAALADFDGLVLILYGDVPLLTEALLRDLVDKAGAGTLSLVTLRLANPKGYGRIGREPGGKVARIVEEKDCTDEQRAIDEVNAGIYCLPARFLFEALRTITPNNAQGELYLTDVVEQASHKLHIVTVEAPEAIVQGCNDRVDVARADRVMRLRLVDELQRSGVSVRDPERCFVEPGQQIGPDTELGPNVELRGRVTIGSNCRIEQGCVISDSVLGDNVHVKAHCVIAEAKVGNAAMIGPFAQLRPGTDLADEVHIGNFVETKKTKMGRGSKANHLTYLGDATVGQKVNVGCGTSTCHYDGYNKYETVIEDGVFLGSDTALVAPVRVGAGAITAAGSVIVEDVPPDALAVARGRQSNKLDYARLRREQMQKKK